MVLRHEESYDMFERRRTTDRIMACLRAYTGQNMLATVFFLYHTVQSMAPYTVV